MIENDSRRQNRGFKLRQNVTFRWCGMSFEGTIVRLTDSKALIRFVYHDEVKWSYIAYRQITP